MLNVRREERNLAFLITLVFALSGMAISVGGVVRNTVLVENKELVSTLFMIMGIAGFLFLLIYATSLDRFRRDRLFTVVPLALAAVLAGEYLISLSRWAGSAILAGTIWVSVELFTLFFIMLAWNVAGETHDPLQSKRLFPLYVSGHMGGKLLGNIIALLVSTLPALSSIQGDSLTLGVAALIGLGTVAVSLVLRRYLPQASHRPPPPESGFFNELQNGFIGIRNSPLLIFMTIFTVVITLQSGLITYLFADAQDIARPVINSIFGGQAIVGFGAVFYLATNALVFLSSLLLAGRLYNRIGFIEVFLILPVIELFSYVAILLAQDRAPALVLTAGSFAQMSKFIVFYGLTEGARNAVFNVVPLNKRSQVRSFNSAVARQTGTLISGFLVLLLARLPTAAMVAVGLSFAAMEVFLIWRLRREYLNSLFDALEANRLDFFDEAHVDETGFVGYARRTAGVQLALEALKDERPSTRMVGVTMLARMNAKANTGEILAQLDDPDPGVRLATVHALEALEATETAQPLAKHLGDGDPEVRRAIVQALPRVLSGKTDENMIRTLRALTKDQNLLTKIEATASLMMLGNLEEGWKLLHGYLVGKGVMQRNAAVNALGRVLREDTSLPEQYVTACEASLLACLDDPEPLVRISVCKVLESLKTQDAIEGLVERLTDDHTDVRAVAARSIESHGREAQQHVITRLCDPGWLKQDSYQVSHRNAALDALTPLPEPDIDSLNCYLEIEAEWLERIRAGLNVLPEAGVITTFIHKILNETAHSSESRIVQTIALRDQDERLLLISRQLRTHDPSLRATALEALSNLKYESRRINMILYPEDDQQKVELVDTMHDLIDQQDDYISALGLAAIGELKLHDLSAKAEEYIEHEESLLQQAAEKALQQLSGEQSMNGRTISSLERVILLKQSDLFDDLSLDDLKRVAEIAVEKHYQPNAPLFNEGDEGREVFFIVEGSVNVVKQSRTKSVIVATLGNGEIIGEFALLDNLPRSASIVAAEQVHVLSIERDAFLAIVRERSEVALTLLRTITRRLRETTMELQKHKSPVEED